MTEPTRWVAIDDADTRIQHSGSWTSVTGSGFNDSGNFGPVYRNTLRGSNTTGSTISFTFTGNAVAILGTNGVTVDSNGVADPDWDCMVDGQVFPKRAYFPYLENNWLFCQRLDLPDAQHTVKLAVKSKIKTFWFDQIQYRPTVAVQNEVIVVDDGDPSLTYSKNWSRVANLGHMTHIKGSTATLRFNGTGVTLRAAYPAERAHGASVASYTIDSGAPVNFTIPGGDHTSVFNRKIIEILGLSPQAHTLVITHQGTTATTPLVLGQFFVEDSTNLRAELPPQDGDSSATPPSTNPPNNKVPVGLVVGGVLGALAVISIVVVVLVWIRLRRQSRLKADPFTDGHPFNTNDIIQAFRLAPLPTVRPFRPAPVTKGDITTVVNSSAPSVPQAATRAKMEPPLPIPSVLGTSSGDISEQTGPPWLIPPHSSGVNSLAPAREVLHEDSGIRLPIMSPPARIVEHPPAYTPD